MAGSQDQKENPVAINVVPMVDVIFCLCVFFMCSLKFKQLEGKFDSWLPRDKGVSGPSKIDELIKEIRVAMFWDATQQKTVRKLGLNTITSDEELERHLVESRQDMLKLGKPENEIPVTIDAEGGVPWHEVINVVNLCRRNRLEKIEFAFGAKA